MASIAVDVEVKSTAGYFESAAVVDGALLYGDVTVGNSALV